MKVITDNDDLYDECVAIVRRDGKSSTSHLQKCLKIGYNRAVMIQKRMVREGVLTPYQAQGLTLYIINM